MLTIRLYGTPGFGPAIEEYVAEAGSLAALGVDIDQHGKMPDLVVYQPDKNWLFLMEAASTRGPMDHIRYRQLSGLFSGSTAGLVYVSCFPDRAVMRRFLPDLAWETKVWLASEPTHMIHLNGEKFLGQCLRQGRTITDA